MSDDTQHASDLELDRLRAGELSPTEERAVRAKIAASPESKARWEAIERGFPDEFPAERVLSRIMDATEGSELSPELQAALDAAVGEDGDPAPTKSAWARFVDWVSDGWQPRTLIAGVAAAAAVLAVAITGQQPIGPLDPGVRLKGGVGLTVYRMPAGAAEATEAISGDTFVAGDRLRFAVDLPEDGHLLIAYVASDGATAAAWPFGGDAALPIEAGAEQELDGAVALDAAPGPEWLHAVLCEAPFRLEQVVPAGGEAGLVNLPKGCVETTFELKKAGR